MIRQAYRLDMVPGERPTVVYVKQYDRGSRALEFQLHKGITPWEVPEGATVTIDGTKADGKGFSYIAEASGSTVTVTVTQQMTAAAGRAACQLTVTKGENVLGSARLALDVERAALPEDADMSKTDISSLETWKNQALNASAAAEAAQEKAEAAQEAAETAEANAATAASTASTKASEAETSAANAAGSATEAASSASTASAKASEAAISASEAEAQAKAAETASAQAGGYAAQAEAFSTEAQGHKEETAALKEQVEALKTQAEEAKAASEKAQSEAEGAAQEAAVSEGNAEGHATAAGQSATLADTAAAAATTKATEASTSADDAEDSAKTAEAWAVGQRDGMDVVDTDPTYQNSSKYHAEESKAAKQDIEESIEGVAQEDTAQSLNGAVSEILALVQELSNKGSGLNGFTLSLGDNDEVILSYTDPEDETNTDSVTLPTNTTGAAIVEEYEGIGAALAEIAGKETT